MLDSVTLAIYCYAFTCGCEVIIAVFQHLAQFKPTTKNMTDILPEDKIEKGAKYEMAKCKFKIFNCFYTFAKDLIVMIYLGQIYQFLQKIKLNADVAIFLFIFLIDKVTKIPISLFYDFGLEAYFGYNKKTFGTWLYDLFAESLVTCLLLWPIYGTIIFLIRKYSTFYIHVTLFILFFRLLMLWIYPTIIAPIFNKFVPFDNEKPLYEKIQNLAKEVGFEIKGIFVMDGSRRSGHSNAYFTGLGKQKRVVFFDTLLNQLKTDEQVLGVLAHEFGHFKRSHNLIFLFIDTFGMLGVFILMNKVFSRMLMPIGLKLFLFISIVSPFGYIFAMFRNFCSRLMEKDADMFAIKLNYGKELIQSLKILVEENTSTLKNSYIHSLVNFSHTNVIDRIEFIEENVKSQEDKKK